MVTGAMAACLGLLSGDGDGRGGGLAAVAAEAVSVALGVTGAAVSVAVRAVDGVSAQVWGDDPVSVGLADLQLTLGEGPVVDASFGDLVVLEPDLAVVPVGRWPAFTAEAVALGVRAVFALPLRLGVIRVGTLVLHRKTAGPLSVTQLGDALTFADAVTLTLLIENEIQAGARSGDTAAWAAIGHDTAVYQASGMVSVQLGVTVAEALVRLRAYAYGNNRSTGEVAADVVARRLRFDGTER